MIKTLVFGRCRGNVKVDVGISVLPGGYGMIAARVGGGVGRASSTAKEIDSSNETESAEQSDEQAKEVSSSVTSKFPLMAIDLLPGKQQPGPTVNRVPPSNAPSITRPLLLKHVPEMDS
jgi:hypothetical protein